MLGININHCFGVFVGGWFLAVRHNFGRYTGSWAEMSASPLCSLLIKSTRQMFYLFKARGLLIAKWMQKEFLL